MASPSFSSSSSSSLPMVLPSSIHPSTVPRPTTGGRTFVPPSATPYLNPAERRNMEIALDKCCEVVCHIRPPSPGKRGSGFLIGPTLLLTCFHVLPSEEVARNSGVFFFQVVSQRGAETWVKIVKIVLDPDACFIQSPRKVEVQNGVETVLPADATHLDFTVVAIKADPVLATIQDAILDIFEQVSIIPDTPTPICVIQCPEVFHPDSLLQGDLSCDHGQVSEVRAYTLLHNAPTDGGSSGGPIVNRFGKPIAMHHQAVVGGLKAAILTTQIAGVLNRQTGKKRIGIDNGKAPLPSPSIVTSSSLGIFQPLASQAEDFVGRANELQALHSLLRSTEDVAVVGLGGVGKTALVASYVAQKYNDYHHIYCIDADTIDQLQRGLFDLTEEMEIPSKMKNLKPRLGLLGRRLFDTNEALLLVCDNVDQPEVLVYLGEILGGLFNPNGHRNSRIRLLITSRLREHVSLKGLTSLSLDVFNPDDAVDYLISAVGEKDPDRRAASNLARTLGGLPLALKHAAAYIRFSESYTFDKYADEYVKVGPVLLGPRHVTLDPGEQVISTTWKKSIEAIKALPNGELAEDVLNVLSIFAPAAIPSELIMSLDHRIPRTDLETALKRLSGYCLIQPLSSGYQLHVLQAQVIREGLDDALTSYCGQAFDMLFKVIQDWDVSETADRRRMDSYLSHIEAVLKQAKDLNLASLTHSTEFGVALSLLCTYYRTEQMVENLKQTAEMRLDYLIEDIPSPQRSREIGVNLLLLRRYSEALPWLLATLEYYQENYGMDHLKTADLHRDVGACLLRKKEYQKAREHDEKALFIYKKLLGDAHRKTSQAYFELATVFSYLRDREKALKYHRFALKIRQKQLGECHYKTALSMIDVALCRDLLKIGGEQPLKDAERGLKILKEQLGDNHPEVARVCSALALAYQLKKSEKDLQYGEHVPMIFEGRDDEDPAGSVMTYLALANNSAEQGSYDAAFVYLQKARSIATQKLGPENPLKAAIEIFFEKLSGQDDQLGPLASSSNSSSHNSQHSK